MRCFAMVLAAVMSIVHLAYTRRIGRVLAASVTKKLEDQKSLKEELEHRDASRSGPPDELVMLLDAALVDDPDGTLAESFAAADAVAQKGRKHTVKAKKVAKGPQENFPGRRRVRKVVGALGRRKEINKYSWTEQPRRRRERKGEMLMSVQSREERDHTLAVKREEEEQVAHNFKESRPKRDRAAPRSKDAATGADSKVAATGAEMLGAEQDDYLEQICKDLESKSACTSYIHEAYGANLCKWSFSSRLWSATPGGRCVPLNY